MVEKGPSLGQEDNKDYDKPARPGDSFMARIHHLFGNPRGEQKPRKPETDDDDDDEEEASEKKGLWPRFQSMRAKGFGKFFSKQVAEVVPVKPADPETAVAEQSDKTPFLVPVEQQPTLPYIPDTVTTPGFAAEAFTSPTPMDKETAVQGSDIRVEAATVPTPSTTEQFQPLPIAQTESTTPIELPLIDRTPSAAPAAALSFDRDQSVMPQATKTIERERVVESPRAAVAGFVAGEFLSRRRDRELRRSTADVAQKAEQTSKNLSNETSIIREMEQRVAQAREQLKANRRHTETQASRTATIFDRQEQRLHTLEHTPATAGVAVEQPYRQAPTPETAPPPIFGRARASSNAPETVVAMRTEQLGTRPPEIILQKAEVAVEDLPVEKFYEQRHERKDEPRNNSGQGGASAVGSVLADRSHQDRLIAAALQQSATARPTNSTGGILQNDTYKKAVSMGAGAALLIVVLLGLMLLVS